MYYLVEAFTDAAAGETHITSGHVKAAIAGMPGLLAEPLEIIHADIPAEDRSQMAELPTAGE